mmetsp:Transcript_10107/g.27885  ORF Transcript_10107/g.27885 Transcript_10107/m.27885 type:complete len:291 (+) Transcript_10107:109-981(+)
MTPKREHHRSRVSISSLREALELVEGHRIVVTTMDDAAQIWQRIRGFRPAQVLFSTEFISPKFFEADLSETTQRMISDHLEVFREISDCREFKCCRGPAVAKHLPSSEIVAVVQPLMTRLKNQQQRGKKKKKLSQYSELIDVLMKYTHVNVDEGGLDDWEDVEDWINATVTSCPLLAEIADPAFMIIRGHGGGGPPAWIQTQLDAIPVGRPSGGGLSQPAIAANVQVRRAAGQPAIPNFYQFADLADARIARAALQAHANALATATGDPLPGVQLDILRLNVQAGGMVWI